MSLNDENHREHIYRVLRQNASRAMSVKRKKKHVSLERERLSQLKMYTHSAEQLNRLKKTGFSPFRFPKTKPSFLFAAFLRSICCAALNAFSNGTSEKLPASLYSSFTRYAVRQISW